jgi:hypothetical protein
MVIAQPAAVRLRAAFLRLDDVSEASWLMLSRGALK